MRVIPHTKGFTLVEMIVAVGLFAVVMIVSVGALLALVGANRKAQALQSVMNNLDVTLDGMARGIRMGTTFDGSLACSSNNGGPKDCTGGGSTFSFEPYGQTPSDPPWIYTYNSATKSISKTVNGTAIGITAPEISIDSMTFYVVGTNRGCTVTPCDTVQPKVVIVVSGTAPVLQTKTRTTFHIQVTAVQRVLDL